MSFEAGTPGHLHTQFLSNAQVRPYLPTWELPDVSIQASNNGGPGTRGRRSSVGWVETIFSVPGSPGSLDPGSRYG